MGGAGGAVAAPMAMAEVKRPSRRARRTYPPTGNAMTSTARSPPRRGEPLGERLSWDRGPWIGPTPYIILPNGRHIGHGRRVMSERLAGA